MSDWRDVAVERVQAIYDAWTQDEDGMDDEYGGGGICDDVADAIATAMQEEGIEAGPFHHEQDNHTVVIAKLEGQTVEVNIPLHLYEKGGWYSYTKIEGVTFTPEFITIIPLGDEAMFDTYFDE